MMNEVNMKPYTAKQIAAILIYLTASEMQKKHMDETDDEWQVYFEGVKAAISGMNKVGVPQEDIDDIITHREKFYEVLIKGKKVRRW